MHKRNLSERLLFTDSSSSSYFTCRIYSKNYSFLYLLTKIYTIPHTHTQILIPLSIIICVLLQIVNVLFDHVSYYLCSIISLLLQIVYVYINCYKTTSHTKVIFAITVIVYSSVWHFQDIATLPKKVLFPLHF